MSLEILESRIAPAAVLPYTDADGDKVTIKSTAGTLADLTAAAHFSGTGATGLLTSLDLSASIFNGASITISVVRAGNGDGLATVGQITSTHDLGAISIKGDLGSIVAGDSATPGAAVKSLTVDSLGRYGMATGATTLTSTLTGALGALTVTHDVTAVDIESTDAIGNMTIKGSLIGGSADNSGKLHSATSIGLVKISGNILGGDGVSSGQVLAGTSIAGITVGGSLIGGLGNYSGQITATTTLGPVKVTGDLRAHEISGTALDPLDPTKILQLPLESAKVQAGQTIASLTVGGSIIGHGSQDSVGFTSPAQVTALGGIGPVKVTDSLLGGLGNGSGSIITLGGTIASISVGGDLHGADG